jgi:hypothetical protein
MEIRTDRFDDSSAPDENGMYEYQYTGTNYHVSEGDRTLIFRSYDDSEPGELTLIHPTEWTQEDLRGGLIARAIRSLYATAGARVIRLYNRTTGGYSERVMADGIRERDLERYTRALTRRTTLEEVGTRLPEWAEGFVNPEWFWPSSGPRWEEFLTGLYGEAELWEYCIPFEGETGEGGYAIVRQGEVEEVYMLAMS